MEVGKRGRKIASWLNNSSRCMNSSCGGRADVVQAALSRLTGSVPDASGLLHLAATRQAH